MRNQKPKNKKTKVGNRKAGSRLNVERMEHPPQLEKYQVVHSTSLRFTVTAAVVNQNITNENLLDAMLVAVSAIAGFQLFDSFKLKYVEIWGQAALGTPSTVGLQFNVVGSGDFEAHTDTSLGIKPAYIRAGPSSKSLASFWTTSSAAVSLKLTAPAGSIVDVHLAYRTSSLAPTALQNALVGAAAGEFYFRGLDGLAIAGTNFPPPNGVNVQ